MKNLNLRGALLNNEITVLYQPKVGIMSTRVEGVEALLRWYHPERGLIPPAEFIALAESSGDIHLLGDWVLEESCRQLRAWEDSGSPPCSMAVNVSPMQLRRAGFEEHVLGMVKKYGIEPDRLILEITESCLMQDEDACMDRLFVLMGGGIQISLDDFGTGFSSLSRLKSMPMHEIKIAKEFINDLDRSDCARAIVAAIMSMASVMNLRVIAEGVERTSQVGYLRSFGCDQWQGFLCSPPAAPSAISRILGLSSDPLYSVACLRSA